MCFGAGLAPQGERVEFDLSPDRLVLWPGMPRERSVPYEVIRTQPGGFHRELFHLTWSEDGVPWALVLEDRGLADAVRRNPPPGLRAEIDRLNAGLARGRVASGIGWSIIAAIVALPVLGLALLWWQADRLVGLAVDRIPIEWEEQLGDTAYAQITQGARVLSDGAAVEAVAAIGSRLAAHVDSPYTFKWHVIDDPQVNAFAMPGGHVVVLTGLLREADSPEELAGVLAHETQHVVLRHSLRGLVRTMGWTATIRILFGSSGPLGGVGELASRLGSLTFSREQEREADLEGLKLLRRAKIKPEGMVTFFDKLARREAGIALLSTHPASADRAERLRAEIAQAGPWPVDPLPVAWAGVRAAVAAGP